MSVPGCEEAAEPCSAERRVRVLECKDDTGSGVPVTRKETLLQRRPCVNLVAAARQKQGTISLLYMETGEVHISRVTSPVLSD